MDTIDLERCLKLLRPEQARLLLSVSAEGRSFSEVAQTLDCSPGLARQQHDEALDALTTLLVKMNLLP